MKKYKLLNTALLLIFLFIAISGILMDFHVLPKGPLMSSIKAAHTYLGYVMIAGIALHLIWHRTWIRQAFRKGNN